MKDTELDLFDDFPISYDVTISTINKIFKDEIQHCRQDIDIKLSEYLVGFKDEFLAWFDQVYKDEEYKKNQRLENLNESRK